MATYLPSRKPFKLKEQYLQDTAGEVRTNSCDVLLWTPSHGRASVGRPARTYQQHLCTDTGCWLEDRQWTIETNDERESGKSMLVARDDDDDDGNMCVYVCVCVCMCVCVLNVSTQCCFAQSDTPTAFLRVVIPPHATSFLIYDTKQSDGDVPVMLELWGMWSTPSLLLIPGPPRPGVVAPDRVQSMSQKN